MITITLVQFVNTCLKGQKKKKTSKHSSKVTKWPYRELLNEKMTGPLMEGMISIAANGL